MEKKTKFNYFTVSVDIGYKFNSAFIFIQADKCFVT